MLRTHPRLLPLLITGALSCMGCSGADDSNDGSPAEPLRGGAITAVLLDMAFTPTYAVAIAGGQTADGDDAPDGMTIHLGTTGLGCQTDFSRPLPPGMYVKAETSSRTVGEYPDHRIITSKRHETGGSTFAGSSQGTLTSITSVDADEVAGSLSMLWVDIKGSTTSVSGDFVVARCFD